MSIERPDEAALFDQAIQIADRQSRSDFLDKACGDDAALRESLEELLACHDTAGDYLETSPVRPIQALQHESPGDRIDRYELIERIGEGGFGVVYRSMQLTPVRRIVALKVIRVGMDSDEVIRRFETERQVMSMMTHPHIASVFDAGTTESGRPYFVMEYVDGDAIDQYCDRHQLTVPEVLNLLLDVCFAIQHAHQKGVVHRDLKPSNVIVVVDDSRPIPKVIDFGIAKALTRSADQPLYQTVEHRVLGTPGYMSPEQIAGDADIDTRADIYALGGILYRLLVGVEPFDAECLKGLDIADTYRQIRDAPIQRPSLRLRSLDGPKQRQIALQRQSNPALLHRTLTGDLDWIVVRALEKDRSRRYGTVQELAADIQRFLRHEPVSAGPPTAGYRFRKLVRRNRMATVACLIVVVSLVAGGALATIGRVRARHESQRATEQWRRAERQSHLAAIESGKAKQTLVLLENLIGASHPDRGLPANYTMQQLLDDFADSFQSELVDQPRVAARVHHTVGRAYWSLGDMARAGEHLARSLELYSEQFGDDHLLTAHVRVDHSLYLMRTSRVFEAHETVRRALDVLYEYPDSEQTVWALFVLSRVYQDFGQREDAREYITRARDVARKTLGPAHPLSISMRMRASLRIRNLGQADQESRAALDEMVAVRGADHIDVADAKRQRAAILLRLQRPSEAESLVHEAMRVHETLQGPNNSHLAHDMLMLTRTMRQSGQRNEAIVQARRTLDLAGRVTIERELLRQKAYQSLAALLERVSPSEAIDVWEKAIDSKQQVVGKHAEVARLLNRQAGLYVRLGKLTEAAECYARSLKIFRDATQAEIARGMRKRASSEFMEAIYYTAALDLLRTLIQLDRIPEARVVADDIRIGSDDVKFPRTASVINIVEAQMSLTEGDLTEAERNINAAFAKLQNSRYVAIRARAILVAGEILTKLGRYDEAQRKLNLAYRALRRQRGMPVHLEYSVAKQLSNLHEQRNRPIVAAMWLQRAQWKGGSAGDGGS